MSSAPASATSRRALARSGRRAAALVPFPRAAKAKVGKQLSGEVVGHPVRTPLFDRARLLERSKSEAHNDLVGIAVGLGRMGPLAKDAIPHVANLVRAGVRDLVRARTG